MPLNFSNPIGQSAQAAITVSQRSLGRSGEAIATGKRSPVTDIVGYILGSSLSNQVAVLESILKGTSYGGNMLSVAMNDLQSVEHALVQQLKIIGESGTPGQQQLNKLQETFNKLTDAVTRIANNSEFDGRKLLTGELGGNTAVRNAFDTVAVGHKTSPGAIPNVFAAIGAAANSTITIGGNPNAGEKVIVNGVTFEWIAAGGVPANPHQVAIGINNNATAQNLAAAIQKAPDEALKHITAEVAAGVVTIRTPSQTNAAALPISSSDNLGGAGANVAVVNNAAAANPITLIGVKNSAFIGSITPNLTVTTHAGGVNADALAVSYGLVPAAANPGNRASEFICTIGTETYKGALFMANGGNLNSAVLKMKSTEGSEFSVNFDAAYAGVIGTFANAQGVATTINNLFAGSTFSQTQYLEIDTSGGNIVLGSNLLGTTTGLVATLNSTDFSGKTFDDLTITNNAGNAEFTVKIDGKTFTTAAIAPATLVEGFKVDMIEATSGDVFSLYLGGTNGLTNMTTQDQMTAVQDAFKEALGIGQGLKIRAGVSFSDTINVSIDKVTPNQLYLDNAGAYQANLDIKTDAGRKTSNEVLENAIDKIRGLIASIGSQISNLELASDAIDQSRLAQQDAADDYLSTNYEQEIDNYTENLNKIQAAIATIIKSAALATAVLQLIQNA